MRPTVASFVVALSLALASSVAFAQPAVSVPSAPAMPDADDITGFCREHPPTARPGAASTRYLTERADGSEAFGNALFAVAASHLWAAFALVAVDPTAAARRLEAEIGNQLAGALRGLGPSARAQRCAVLNCLVARGAVGPPQAPFAAQVRELGCNAQSVVPANPTGPTPPVVDTTFAMTDVERRAYAFDTALQQRVQEAHALTVVGGVWRLSVAFRGDLTAAVHRYEIAQGSASTTPRRSVLGYSLPIGLWGAGAVSLAVGIVSGLSCLSANAELGRANLGQTNGWPRDVAADAANSCLRANILIPMGVGFLGGGTAAWFLTRPRVSLVPAHAGNPGFTFTASF